MFQFSELPRPVIRHLNGFWRRRWIILAIAWTSVLLAWFAVWLIPDRYESRAQIFVQTETILEPVLNGFTARPNYEQRVEVMRLQLLTRPNVEEVIIRSGLDKEIRASSNIERRVKMEGMIKSVAAAIKIESPRNMYFNILYKHRDAEIARAVVDAVLNMLIEQDLGASLTENEAARRQLNLQIEEYEEKLAAFERKVGVYRREHAEDLALSEGATRRNEQKESELARAGDELTRLKGRVLTLQNLLSATARTSSGGELDKLKVELADLRSKYKESHPDIRGVVARIEQLERDGGGALSANPEYVRLDSELRVARDSISALEVREERLRQELDAMDFAAGEAPEALAGLQQIDRGYDTTKKTYEELLRRRDRLELTESLGAAGRGVKYQIFERPERALVPVDPPRILLIFGAVVLAAGAGAGAGMLMTAMDKSYTQASELEAAFGLPVLGAVSQTASAEFRTLRRRDFNRLAAAGAALVLLCAFYAYFAVYRLPSSAALQDAPLKVDLRNGVLR